MTQAQWALDSRTRPSHAHVDGEIRELDEKFSNGLDRPGDPNGTAAEVINCRCACLTRARWALDSKERDALKERADYFGLDKTANFEDFKSKYLDSSEQISFFQDGDKVSPPKEYKGNFSDFETLRLSNEENKALTQIHYLTKSTGYEYGTIIEKGKVSKPITSKMPDTVKISLEGYGDELTVLHSHTNDTLPSVKDFQRLLDKKVAKIGVVGYNNDACMVYVGNGRLPSTEEFEEDVAVIRNEVNSDIMNDPSFYDWTVSERTYMAIREQAYRIALHYGWTIEGGIMNG